MKEHIQRTLVILKPDAVQRTLMGDIIQRFERVGLKFIAMKFIQAPPETVAQHYSSDPEWKRKTGERVMENLKEKNQDAGDKTAEEFGAEVLDRLVAFMTAGPVLIMVLEGAYAISLTRKMVGGTEPLSSDVGTIRGDLVLDSYALADAEERAVRNAVHASGNLEEAEKEIALWFDPAELLSYRTVHEQILYGTSFGKHDA